MDAPQALIPGPAPFRPRIQRDTRKQARHLPRALRQAQELLAHAQCNDPAWLLASVERRLCALGPALLRSPYYAGALRAAGLSPRDLQTVRDLAFFPTLDRETLKARGADLPAFDPAGEVGSELVAVRTSGSSGDPVTVVKDAYDCLHMWAVLRFWAAWTGVALPSRPRVVLLCSLANALEYSVRLPLLERGALHRISLLREDALSRLRRAAPAVLFSDPAGLHWLAAQEEPPRPRLIFTSAQHFSPDQRQELARAVPAPVVNYYAITEVGPLAWECSGRFHVLLPDVWVESAEGEILVTRLRRSAVPLLRYRTGDRGEVAPEDCACGYRGWSISGFRGRRACSFVTPQGRSVDAWKLVWLFKHYPLRGFRLSQRDSTCFELEVAGPSFDGRDLLAHLRQALGRLGWEEAVVRLRAVPDVTSSGEKPEPFRRLWA